MGTIFNYNGKLIQCKNLKKKLKKLHLTESDIEIVKDEIPDDLLEKEFNTLVNGVQEDDNDSNYWKFKYAYRNKKDNSLILSIYPNLDNLKGFINVNDYEAI